MLNSLLLEQPLVFFDLETTGINTSKDRIIELYAVKIFPDKTRAQIYRRFNPEIPIPADASAVHGITNAMVAQEPPFKKHASELFQFFSGCDIAGFNIVKFDIPILVEEFFRAGIADDPFTASRFVDCYSIFHKKEPRNLAAALQFYAQEELLNAHSAEADVEATIKILQGQLSKYPDLEPNVDMLSAFSSANKQIIDYDGKFSRNADGRIVFTFGTNKGKAASDNPGMLQWMLQQDFSGHTKYIARKILAGELQ